MAVVVAVAGTAGGCTVTRVDAPAQGPVTWDLRTGPSAADLEGGLDREAILSTPGRDGVALRVVLPDGEVVDLAWANAVAVDGPDRAVERIGLSTTTYQAPALWEARIDGFVARFGGDRAAIDEWLAASLDAVAGGETVTGRGFPGDPRATYQPRLSIRPGGVGGPVDVVVAWEFDITR